MVANKSILFFSPAFFGIEKAIVDELRRNGNRVDWFDERPFTSSFKKALRVAFPFSFQGTSNRYFNNIIRNLNCNYDYILIIKGEMVSKKTLLLLRSCFPEAKLILYLWDPVKYIKKIDKMFKYYDVVYSFDSNDCEKYKVSFRPLFCDIVSFNYSECEKKNNICFFGTMYRDRFSIINEIKKICLYKKKSFNFFCYLQGRFMKIYYSLTNRGFRKFDKNSLSLSLKSNEEISEMIRSSEIVLDINDVNQSGLTIRTFEALLLGKKIITTNNAILSYPFYNENNICVIDRKNIYIPEWFWDSPYIEIKGDILSNYTPKGWIDDVFK